MAAKNKLHFNLPSSRVFFHWLRCIPEPIKPKDSDLLIFISIVSPVKSLCRVQSSLLHVSVSA